MAEPFNHRPEPDGSERSNRTIVERVLTASVVIVVLGLVAVGAGRVASSGSDEARAEPGAPVPVVPAVTPRSSATPVPSTTPSPAPLVDVSFVDAETGHATPLPRSIRSIPGATQFAASPDGRRLAFAAGGKIYIATTNGGSVHEVAGGAAAPSWAADGERLVFNDDEHVYVLDRRNGRVERIATGHGHISHANFSPDGRTVLFTMVSPGGLDLWTVPAAGGPLEPFLRLSMPHTNAAFGSFGPDGRVAYRRTQYDGVDITQMTGSAVWIADRRGAPGQQVNGDGGWMSQGDPDALWPAWSPDGSMIAFERLISLGVAVVDLRTGAHRLLGEGTKPTWVDDRTLIIENYVRRVE